MTDQLTDEDLKGMTSEEISDAYDAGRLLQMLGATDDALAAHKLAVDAQAVYSHDDIRTLTNHGYHDAVSQAHAEDRINTEETP